MLTLDRTTRRTTRTTTAPARADLRKQIARLERELADTVVSGVPVQPCRGAGAGPRLLGMAQLEAQRDALLDALTAARAQLAERGEAQEAARLRLEAMLADPPAHRGERVALAELGEGGCGVYSVGPRLGLVGMLAGWWEVKLSSGCPLAAARPQGSGARANEVRA